MEKRRRIAGILLALLAPLARAEDHGRVCVVKTAAVSFKTDEALSSGDASTGQFVVVQIDDLKKQPVSTQQAADFLDLNLKKKHRIKIYDARGEKQLISFSFNFEEKGSTTLCMEQNAMYRTWSLDASGIGCTCPAL